MWHIISSMQKEKFTILFTVLVDVLGFGIVIPILPFYVTSFGASAFTVTLLFSSFALFAFLSSPFLGALSDKIGRRPVLLFSIASTAVGWFVFASAESVLFLFIGRIIDGAAAGNFTVAQSVLVDISKDEKDRAANLGLIGASFGIGFMLGPLIGGLLSTVSHSFPFWIAGALATLNVVLTYANLRETNARRDPSMLLSVNPLAPLARAVMNIELRPFFLVWMLFGISFMSVQTIFALFVEKAFSFDSFTTGLLFSAMGVFTAINQGILLKRFWLRYFSEAKLEYLMTIVLFVSMVLMSLENLLLFYLAIFLNANAQSNLRVVITSRVAGIAAPHMKGEILGIMSSLMAASMVIAPIIAGGLFELGISLPFVFGAILMAISVFLEWKSYRMSPGTANTGASVRSG